MAQATILVVDDELTVRETLEDYLTTYGYRIVTAASAEAALEVLERSAVDLILTDVHMQSMSGVELCARLKGEARFQFTPIVLLTAHTDLEARVAGLAAGADDFFAKPVEFAELRTRVAVLLRVKDLLDQLERAENVITTLGVTIEARDPYTGGHCQRLARYALALGRALGVDEPMLKALWLGGFLHDLGKVAVPDRILLKPGRLDLDERRIIQTHPAIGAEMVQLSSEELERLLPRARPSPSGPGSWRWWMCTTHSARHDRIRRRGHTSTRWRSSCEKRRLVPGIRRSSPRSSGCSARWVPMPYHSTPSGATSPSATFTDEALRLAHTQQVW